MTAVFRIAKALCAAIPNLLVLGMLLGLGYWGHVYHWQIPRFGALTGAAGAHQPAPSGEAAEGAAAETNATGSTTGPTAPAPNPEAGASDLIHFASDAALDKSGIHIGTVQERRMDEFIMANGVVGYDESRLAQLSCRASGSVWRVEKQLGDVVRKGDVLAIIDSNEVGRAKSELVEATVKCDLEERTIERMAPLAGGAISKQAFREAEAEARVARVRRFSAQQALINLGFPPFEDSAHPSSEIELAEHLHFLGLPREIVSALDSKTTSANLIPLISPLDGMVIQREIVTGEVVDPTKLQFIVADVGRMWLMLNVRSEDAAGLEIGQLITFSASGLAGEVESTLSWIATETDKRTRTVQVRAELENPLVAGGDEAQTTKKRLLRANMFGTGRIRIRQRPDALVVPTSAVQWDGTQHLIFSPADGGTSFRAHPVQVGIVREGYTEIRRGANLGQRIVTSGSYLLKSELIGLQN